MAAEITSTGDCVVLLHGLARTALAMRPLQRALTAAGYTVFNINYPSTRHRIETLANQHLHAALVRCNLSRFRHTHVVTHSMGGIVLRYYLMQHEIAGLQRVVMLAPPNQGSELVDTLGRLTLFRWLNGPAGGQLGTARDSLPNRLGPVRFDVAVIAGSHSLNPFYSWLIRGDNDGKVSVARAGVAGMRAFRVVRASHTFIMRNAAVVRMVVRYLREGML